MLSVAVNLMGVSILRAEVLSVDLCSNRYQLKISLTRHAEQPYAHFELETQDRGELPYAHPFACFLDY